MKLALIAIPLACLSLAGCVEDGSGPSYSSAPPVQQMDVRTGTIVGVRNVEVQTHDGNREAAGTLLGAAAGGLLGNQFGKGGGKTAATIVGVGAGAAIGNSMAKSGSNSVSYSRAWSVRLDHRMGMISVIQDGRNLRVGDRVRVIGNGNNVHLEHY
ncbi:outer membrane lipoprotein [Acidimangrovimonas sediminis]|uniref:glycine zipper 2TM domain-containing protein n=1 Tax=Acidimangrovimonas sediminis TaxID=2056283 RepID=UPI001304D2D4|nr:glycine zipper 2TM domain-containing protein [Acidimangrovimonas sediminis]